jgi:hypothetical protein
MRCNWEAPNPDAVPPNASPLNEPTCFGTARFGTLRNLGPQSSAGRRWCTGFSRPKLTQSKSFLELPPPKGGTPTNALKQKHVFTLLRSRPVAQSRCDWDPRFAKDAIPFDSASRRATRPPLPSVVHGLLKQLRCNGFESRLGDGQSRIVKTAVGCE